MAWSLSSRLNAFSHFAKSRIEGGAAAASLLELLDERLMENPPADDLLAIQASLRGTDAEEIGLDFADFAAQFRAQNGVLSSRCD